MYRKHATIQGRTRSPATARAVHLRRRRRWSDAEMIETRRRANEERALSANGRNPA
jgi:hypothetical protein